MKKFLSVLVILFCLVLINLNIYAQEIVLSTEPVEKIVEPGERVEIKINLDEVTDIEDGINTIVGYLEYEEALFSKIEFIGENNWKVTYNSIKDSELYGKFAITTMQTGVKENQQIATLNVVLKDNLPEEETEIKLNKLVSSDGYDSIKTEEKIIKLKIQKSDIPTKEEIKDTEEKEEISEEIEKPDNNKENIPTGDNLYLYIAIIVVVILINIRIFINRKKENQEK